jgi:hypothetical protein
MNNIAKQNGAFDGLGIIAGDMQILLMVGGFDVGSKTKLVIMYIDIKEGDMVREDETGQLNRVVTVEVLM